MVSLSHSWAFSTVLLATGLLGACVSDPRVDAEPGGSDPVAAASSGSPDASLNVEGAPDGGSGAAKTPRPTEPPCTDRTGAKGTRNITLTGSRTAHIHVPESYDKTKRTPLILNFHGLGSDARQQQILTKMNDASDAKGFIVVYPAGTGTSWNAGDCCGRARTNEVDEIAYVKEVVAAMTKDYCIDSARTFAAGFSNGGFMAHKLACEMSDTFAAIAPVSGVIGVPPETCKPKHPMPVLHIHGDADKIVPYAGGKPVGLDVTGLSFRSVADSTAFWRKQNACPETPQVAPKIGEATCQKWGPCAGGSEVVLCTIEGGGHSWPGGLPLLNGKADLNATDMLVSFFEAHPMP